MRTSTDVHDKIRATFKRLSRNEVIAVYQYGEALALANDPTLEAASPEDLYAAVYEACRTPALSLVSAHLSHDES